MGITKERCFPRGGQKTIAYAGKSKKIHLFDVRRKKKKEKSKEKKCKALEKTPKEILTAETLTYRSVADGMLLLGCVTGVTDYYVRLSLPGRLVGKVSMTNISGPYTKILRSLLDKKSPVENYSDIKHMFKIGQFVVAKVLKVAVSPENNRYKVDLTLDPSSVNVNYTHSSLKTGMVLHGAVKSIEDHGYMIDFGIKSLRAFLKTKNAQKFIDQWNDGRPLGVGQLVPCLVQKVDITSVASIVQVTADPIETSSSFAELNQELNIHTLTPGTLVRSLVCENIRDGIMIEFLNFKGFVYRDHTGDTPPTLADIKNARVLYTLPLLNTVYLSILLGSKDLLTAKKDDERGMPKVGQVIKNAQVLNASKKGLWISMGKYVNCRGFLSRKRLKDGRELPPEKVKGIYPIGKELQVRIVGRDIIENIFICSAQLSILNEKLYSISDLKVGMKVSGTVLALRDNGLEVKLGTNSQVQGFVPLSHLADFPLQFPEKRFPTGKKVTGCVMRIMEEKRNVLLTLKPSLVESDLPVLCTYKEATDLSYVNGTIVKFFDKGLIVAFYNDVKGFVSISETGSSDLSNLKESFFEGQTVKCRIIHCHPDREKLLLSLLLNVDGKGNECPREVSCRIGNSFTLKVEKVIKDGLKVEVIGTDGEIDSVLKGKKGMVPVLHLSDHASLTNRLLETYKSGDEIVSAILHSAHATNDMQPTLIFSLRPSVIEFCSFYFGKNKSGDVEGSEASGDESDDENEEMDNRNLALNKIQVGCILPCSVLEVNSHGLALEGPVPKYGRRMLVPKECTAGDNSEKNEELSFVKNQAFFGKVIKKDVKRKRLIISTILSDVWDGFDIEPSLAFAKSYLGDLHRIQKHWKLVGNLPLNRFVEGQKVKGTVISMSDSGAIIEVNKIVGKKMPVSPTTMAVVIPHHYKKKPIKVGDAVLGRVIFVDHGEGQLYLTLNPKTIDEMEATAGVSLVVGKGVRVEILMCSKDITVGFVKGNMYRGKIVFLPTQRHPNDFYSLSSSETSFKPGEIHKVIISGNLKGKMIGLIKKWVNKFNKYNKQMKLMEQRKRKSEMPNTEQPVSSEVDEKRRKLDGDVTSERQEVIEGQVNGKIKKKDSKKDKISKEKILEMSGDSDSLPKKRQIEKKKLDRDAMNDIGEAVEEQGKKKINKKSVNEESISNEKSLETSDDRDSLARKRQIVNDAKKNADDEVSMWEKLPRLEASEGFVWDVDISSFPQVLPKNKEEDEVSSEEEEVKETDAKGKKGKKKKDASALREEEEARMREAEERLMDPDTCPQTADDFDRLVLSSPDSSIIWLKYVAFHLQNTEIEKARVVAHRALKTINFREEQEKLNIWVCLLNLENLYGTKESLEKVLQDAVQMNDAFKVYCQMMQIYLDSKKIEELDDLMNVMLKKFRDNKEAWVQAGTMCMKSNRPDKAGEILRRSFKSLPKREHVDVICRWAQLEARSECGSVERAQSLLEGVLAACPKRTDIWSSLTDMLVKAGRIEDARIILERAVSQKLAARKMKVVFKKYLAFEEAHGTPDKVARVRQLALDYVEKGMEEASSL